MKKKLLIGFLIIILFLDFLALDDITTGSEPSFFLEYVVLGISILLLPWLYIIWRKIS